MDRHMIRTLQRTRPPSFPDLKTASEMRECAEGNRRRIVESVEEFAGPAAAIASRFIADYANMGYYQVRLEESDIFPPIALGMRNGSRNALAEIVKAELEKKGFAVSSGSAAEGVPAPMVVSWDLR